MHLAAWKISIISIHAPRGGSDAQHPKACPPHPDFNPRSPWGERRCRRCSSCRPAHFNPRSPWGERRGLAKIPQKAKEFQSTLPVGGATSSGIGQDVNGGTFQSTLPVGGATLNIFNLEVHTNISIHAPRGGSDYIRLNSRINASIFQSTLPVGGAT